MEGLRDPLPDAPDGFPAWAERQEGKHEIIEGIVDAGRRIATSRAGG